MSTLPALCLCFCFAGPPGSPLADLQRFPPRGVVELAPGRRKVMTYYVVVRFNGDLYPYWSAAADDWGPLRAATRYATEAEAQAVRDRLAALDDKPSRVVVTTVSPDPER